MSIATRKSVSAAEQAHDPAGELREPAAPARPSPPPRTSRAATSSLGTVPDPHVDQRQHDRHGEDQAQLDRPERRGGEYRRESSIPGRLRSRPRSLPSSRAQRDRRASASRSTRRRRPAPPRKPSRAPAPALGTNPSCVLRKPKTAAGGCLLRRSALRMRSLTAQRAHAAFGNWLPWAKENRGRCCRPR